MCYRGNPLAWHHQLIIITSILDNKIDDDYNNKYADIVGYPNLKYIVNEENV